MVRDKLGREGCLVAPWLCGDAHTDLQRHKVWVCPLFEPFIAWLYARGDVDPMTIPAHVDIPDAAFALAGHRRPGVGVS